MSKGKIAKFNFMKICLLGIAEKGPKTINQLVKESLTKNKVQGHLLSEQFMNVQTNTKDLQSQGKNVLMTFDKSQEKTALLYHLIR